VQWYIHAWKRNGNGIGKRGTEDSATFGGEILFCLYGVRKRKPFCSSKYFYQISEWGSKTEDAPGGALSEPTVSS